MRTGIDPYEYKTPEDLLAKDFIGTNSGNLIYAHGIYRNLVSPDLEIHADNYQVNVNDAAKINKEYDGYIFALADAVRKDFAPKLKQMTKLIKALDIPVYLIGMGVRAEYGTNPEDLSFEFDDVVRDFIKAILEKSNMVGVRGEITAQYLTNIGFENGKDHMAIGCPSIYTFGENFSIRDLGKLPENPTISTNMSKPAEAHIIKYINDLHHKYPKASFLPQGYDEFKLVYSGSSIFSANNGYPSSVNDIQYSTGNAKFFLNAPTWIDYLKTVDLSFGTKLHGNITAMIAGTPAITIPLDARMQELVDYHKLPHLMQSDINGDESLQDLVNRVDLHSPESVRDENYERFINFLKTNGLEPQIQRKGQKVYADELLEKTKLYPMIEGSVATTEAEKEKRMASLNLGYTTKEQALRKVLANSNSRVRTKQAEINKLKKQMDDIHKILNN